MKAKDWVLLIGVNIVITSVIVMFSLFKQNRNTPGETAVKTPPPQAQQADSMADHHKPKPTNSGVFNGLSGKPAPDFTLESYDGRKYSLSALRGENVLLFFNEGLMCYPACWNQIAAFGNDTGFAQKNTIVLNITVDPQDEWKSAVRKMPELAKATVLFDSDRTVSTAYGVMTLSSSMHRGQFPGHSYVIIDKEGIVRFTQDDTDMAVRNKELLAQIGKLP